MEWHFRDLKRSWRKKFGSRSLSKILKAVPAEFPLVKNLENTIYLKIILSDGHTLPDLLAELDNIKVREAILSAEESVTKFPKGMLKLFKLPNLPQLLFNNNTAMAVT